MLAYSGGLDTSIILKWLQTTYGCEVVTFTADLGQGEELEPARKKALLLGIKPENIFVEDLREEFVRDYVFPMFRANTVYEGQYLLGTSIARPLIAKKQIEIAEKVGADAVAHGATGKGNDQVRFELTYYALKPDVTVIAPWREWDLTSRSKLIEFAEKHQIPIAKDKRGEAPFSVDANLLHASSEGKVLEDPARKCPTTSIRAPSIRKRRRTSRPTSRSISSAAMRWRSTARNCRRRALLAKLNELGRANGIGRLDLVENRFVGMKSRGMYETPGGTILLAAHRGIESITLDRGAAHLKDELMPKYAELIYYGFWFAPEREMLQAAIDKSQEFVTGRVRLKLYKGNVAVVGRESKYSLYDQDLVTFEEGAVAYDHRDAEGFIKLNALAAAHARPAAARSSSSIERRPRRGWTEGDRSGIISRARSFGSRAGNNPLRRGELRCDDTQPACRWCRPLRSLMACSSSKTPELDPNIAPTNYKQEILDTLMSTLGDPTNVRDAYISDPVLTPIGIEPALYGLRPLQCARRQPPLHRQHGPHRLFLWRPSQPAGRGDQGAVRQRRLQAVSRTGKALSRQ